MPLESATYISELNSANPGHTDQLGQADSHMRLIKATLLATLPNWTAAALTATQAAIDAAVNAVVNGTVAIIAKAGTVSAPGFGFLGDSNTGIYSPGADQLSITTGGVAAVKVKADQSTEFVGTITAAGAYAGGTGQLVPLGGAILWFDDSLPSGNWAWANGAAISRTTYADLFARWGITYGPGDGSTTFNVPDLRDNVPVGKATMGGVADAARISTYATSTLGTMIGEDDHVIDDQELPEHTHAQTAQTPTFTYSQSTSSLTPGGTSTPTSVSIQTSGGANTVTTNADATPGNTAVNSTTNTAMNVVQPGLVCNWIIRIA